jgi:hypothetical protein
LKPKSTREAGYSSLVGQLVEQTHVPWPGHGGLRSSTTREDRQRRRWPVIIVFVFVETVGLIYDNTALSDHTGVGRPFHSAASISTCLFASHLEHMSSCCGHDRGRTLNRVRSNTNGRRARSSEGRHPNHLLQTSAITYRSFGCHSWATRTFDTNGSHPVRGDRFGFRSHTFS